MRWWSPAFFLGLAAFFLGLATFFLGLAAFFLGLGALRLVGLEGGVLVVIFFLGLFVAAVLVSSASLSANKATRSAFNPVALIPRFCSSSFSSTTFREDQFFEGLSGSRLLFRGDDLLVGEEASSSVSGRPSFEELLPLRVELLLLRAMITGALLGVVNHQGLDVSNRCLWR